MVGIGGYTFSGAVVDTVDIDTDVDIEDHKDENNATINKILTNPRKMVKVALDSVTSPNTTLEAIKKGDTVTINSVGMFVEKCSIKRGHGAMKATLDLLKEDSMTYT